MARICFRLSSKYFYYWLGLLVVTVSNIVFLITHFGATENFKVFQISDPVKLLRPIYSINVSHEDGNLPAWKHLQSKKLRGCHLIFQNAAFLDDRTDKPCLRLYVLYTRCSLYKGWKYLSFSIHSQSDGDRPDQQPTELSNCSLGNEWPAKKRMFNHKAYDQRLITCHNHDNRPITIPNSWVSVTVKWPTIGDSKLDLALVSGATDKPVPYIVCMKPLYGVFTDSFFPEFIEWVELHRSFGVSEFHIYNMTLQTQGLASRIWQYYIDIGILKVHHLPPPFTFNQSKPNDFEMSELLSRTAFLDCVQANYKRTKYILNIDLDEFVIPQKHMNYNSMMKDLFHSDNSMLNRTLSGDDEVNLGSLSAKMFIFLPNASVNTNSSLKTLKYRMPLFYPGVKRSRGPFLMKSFINPKICLLSFHHYCLLTVNGEVAQLDLPDDVVWTHHYRQTDKWTHMKHQFFPRNDAILRFADTLQDKVQNVQQEILES